MLSMSTGVIEGIFVAKEAKAPMEAVSEAIALLGQGLAGDRYAAGQGTFSGVSTGSLPAGREITLIEAEALEGLLRDSGIAISAEQTRRNLLTRGVALNHLVDREFQVGEVRLRGVRLCEPCDHLEGLLTKGVRKGLVHRGGLRADIVSGGTIRTGDRVGVPWGPDSALVASRELVRRYYETLWNPWNFSVAADLLASDLRFRGSLGVEARGLAEFQRYMEFVRAAFPDFHNAIQDLVAEGNQVFARLLYTGTHEGRIFGLNPTGRRIAYAGAALFRIAEGRIAEGWVLGDVADLKRQLTT
jgi:steroid delta-isomerase-like uncharacterized protein